jgi:hypothetical protein
VWSSLIQRSFIKKDLSWTRHSSRLFSQCDSLADIYKRCPYLWVTQGLSLPRDKEKHDLWVVSRQLTTCGAKI